MLDSFQIYEELSQSLGEKAARALTKTLTKIYDDLHNTVTKAEFNELRDVVAELAEAQKRTEERLDTLSLRMEELAEAQKRTEQRVEELAEAQKKTEQRLEELAEAQKKTEESLNKLIKRVDDIEVQLGGLSMAVGYGIEDKLYPHMTNFAKKCFGVNPEKIFLRKNIIYPDGKYDEANLYIEGKSDGKDLLVIGECKAQPGKKDIDRFMKMVSRLKNYFGKEVYPFIVGYTFSPEVEKYILEQYPALKFFRTYEIEFGQY